MKVLAAVDGSPFTKRMLAYLAAHDVWLGPHHEYTVLHSVPSVPPRAAGMVDAATLQGYYEDEAEKVFKPLRSYFKRHGVDPTFVAKVGHAADNIARAAEKGKFDLVVMGSHGHGRLANLVLGSTASKVVAQCGVPVLLIR
jgi:nucleotide-binding universal stress UspA family protein